MTRSAFEYPPSSTLYADLREKWKHEDELINQRVTWLLNSQAFLLSSFGVLAKFRVEAEALAGDISSIATSPLWWLFSLGEFLVALCALTTIYYLKQGISAAISALRALKRQLVTLKRARVIWRGVKLDVLPGITRAGASPAQEMARIIFGVWFLALSYEVYRCASIAVQFLAW
jgi:hypothetical protein